MIIQRSARTHHFDHADQHTVPAFMRKIPTLLFHAAILIAATAIVHAILARNALIRAIFKSNQF